MWCWGLTMGTSTPKGTSVEVGLPRKARVSQEWPWVSRWGRASVEASPRVSRGGDGASPCESKGLVCRLHHMNSGGDQRKFLSSRARGWASP